MTTHNRELNMLKFDADAYWRDKVKKVWVVVLHKTSKKHPGNDKKIVRAQTAAGAVKTAKANSLLSGKLSASVRLATPTDLGIQ